jgi:hypothetical protein
MQVCVSFSRLVCALAFIAACSWFTGSAVAAEKQVKKTADGAFYMVPVRGSGVSAVLNSLASAKGLPLEISRTPISYFWAIQSPSRQPIQPVEFASFHQYGWDYVLLPVMVKADSKASRSAIANARKRTVRPAAEPLASANTTPTRVHMPIEPAISIASLINGGITVDNDVIFDRIKELMAEQEGQYPQLAGPQTVRHFFAEVPPVVPVTSVTAPRVVTTTVNAVSRQLSIEEIPWNTERTLEVTGDSIQIRCGSETPEGLNLAFAPWQDGMIEYDETSPGVAHLTFTDRFRRVGAAKLVVFDESTGFRRKIMLQLVVSKDVAKR